MTAQDSLVLPLRASLFYVAFRILASFLGSLMSFKDAAQAALGSYSPPRMVWMHNSIGIVVSLPYISVNEICLSGAFTVVL